MTKVPVLNFQDFIQADGETLTTSSNQVAAVFAKSHDDLLKKIRALVKELPEDRLGYFAETVELRPNPSGGAMISSPAFRMTRDGFTLLVMGFTGKKALMFKLAYIDAFNAMAAYIKNQREGLQYQFLRKELEYKSRKGQVSSAAREMRCWRDEKPARLSEMDRLLNDMQPTLLPN